MKTAYVWSFRAGMLAFVIGSIGPANAQQTLQDQLTGTWTAVSIENISPDGKKGEPYGPNPRGILFLDAAGRYAQIQVLPDRPKFKVSNRFQGTAEENKATLAGSYASFGSWSVDQGDHTFVRHVEGNAVFPNEEGKDLRLSVTVTGDELKFENSTSGGGGKTVAVWRRSK